MASREQRLRLEATARFSALRRRAHLLELWAKLTRRGIRLLRLDELAGSHRTWQRREGGYRHVPIRAIIGSVGRAHDFTHGFLPRAGAEVERWIGLYMALQGEQGFPEVELLQIGDQYIVEDGHHRISVARAAGLTDIPAHVTQLVAPATVREPVAVAGAMACCSVS